MGYVLSLGVVETSESEEKVSIDNGRGGGSKSRVFTYRGRLSSPGKGAQRSYTRERKTERALSDSGLQRACHLVHAAMVVDLTFC